MSHHRACCCDEDEPEPVPCNCTDEELFPTSIAVMGIAFQYKYEWTAPAATTCPQSCTEFTDLVVTANVTQLLPFNVYFQGSGASGGCCYYGEGTVQVQIEGMVSATTHSNPTCNGVYGWSVEKTLEVPCCLHITCEDVRKCGCGYNIKTDPTKCKGPSVYIHKLEICDFTVDCDVEIPLYCDCDPGTVTYVNRAIRCNGARLAYASTFESPLTTGGAECVSLGWYPPCTACVLPSCTPGNSAAAPCNDHDLATGVFGHGPFSLYATEVCTEGQDEYPPCTDHGSGGGIRTAPDPDWPTYVFDLAISTNGGVDESWPGPPCSGISVSFIQFATPCARPWTYT